jgi:hypothetical protein
LTAGTYGVLANVWRAVLQSGDLARSWANPREPQEQRDLARIKLVARWRGVLDFFRRRFGPPPASLPGLGDTQGTKSGGA